MKSRLEILDINLYLDREWAEALGRSVKKIGPDIIATIAAGDKEQSYLAAALKDLKEALEEAGIA